MPLDEVPGRSGWGRRGRRLRPSYGLGEEQERNGMRLMHVWHSRCALNATLYAA